MQILTKGCWGLLLLAFACQAPKSATQTTAEPGAHQAPTLLASGHYLWQTDDFYFEVAPELGGRMISLRWKGQELLTQQATDSLAYGCSLWPSPMTWRWPPSPVLDREPFQAQLLGDTLSLIGPTAEDFGWRMRKSIRVWPAAGRIVCHYQIENTTDTTRQVAAWEVPRFPKGSEIFARIDTGSLPPKFLKNIPWTLDASGYLHIDVPQAYEGKGQKVSYDGIEPWIGLQYKGVGLIRQSTPLTPDQFAPKSGELEVYVDDDTDYIEVEIQGGYQALKPGESASLTVAWRVMDAPGAPEMWWKRFSNR